MALQLQGFGLLNVKSRDPSPISPRELLKVFTQVGREVVNAERRTADIALRMAQERRADAERYTELTWETSKYAMETVRQSGSDAMRSYSQGMSQCVDALKEERRAHAGEMAQVIDMLKEERRSNAEIITEKDFQTRAMQAQTFKALAGLPPDSAKAALGVLAQGMEDMVQAEVEKRERVIEETKAADRAVLQRQYVRSQIGRAALAKGSIEEILKPLEKARIELLFCLIIVVYATSDMFFSNKTLKGAVAILNVGVVLTVWVSAAALRNNKAKWLKIYIGALEILKTDPTKTVRWAVTQQLQNDRTIATTIRDSAAVQEALHRIDDAVIAGDPSETHPRIPYQLISLTGHAGQSSTAFCRINCTFYEKFFGKLDIIDRFKTNRFLAAFFSKIT
jgi:hypothetical protein